jgi:hypothetical protein
MPKPQRDFESSTQHSTSPTPTSDSTAENQRTGCPGLLASRRKLICNRHIPYKFASAPVRIQLLLDVVIVGLVFAEMGRKADPIADFGVGEQLVVFGDDSGRIVTDGGAAQDRQILPIL